MTERFSEERAMVETQFLGGRKAKLWTYLILGVLLCVAVLIANFAIKNPEAAQGALDGFLGLPGWAYPTIAGVLGAIIFWFGLKMETDWPEFLGALMIGGSVLTAEVLLGWENFEIGGIGAIPFVLPPAVFLVLLIIGMAKSK
jgi:uncharacterized integral membrane protein